MKASILILLIVAISYAARDADLVTTPMPGCTDTSFKMYSGYLDVLEGKKFHYVLAESQNNPAKDPVVFWFNGGPGCSSMIGFIQEHGPCVFLEDSDQAPSDNPQSWNKFANMVYLESPAGVGFNKFKGSYEYDDQNVSVENLFAVQEFFKAFPEYKSNELYLTGESYAGIYVPYLALRIHEHNQYNANDKINLKGFGIGNAVTNWKYDTTPAYIKLAYYHGLIDKTLKEEIDSLDCDFADVGAPPLSTECSSALGKFYDSVKYVYPYDVYRPLESYYKAKSPAQSVEQFLVSDSEKVSSGSFARFSKMFKDVSPNDFAPVNAYMNSAGLKASLNIPDSYSWEECSNIKYEMLPQATQWIYPILKGQYRMMHYSGDTDGVVPTIGTEDWMEDLGWKITKPYTAWLVEPSYIGGFTQSRESLDFITIHGCGHMAPQWKRESSFLAISSWLKGKDLPRK